MPCNARVVVKASSIRKPRDPGCVTKSRGRVRDDACATRSTREAHADIAVMRTLFLCLRSRDRFPHTSVFSVTVCKICRSRAGSGLVTSRAFSRARKADEVRRVIKCSRKPALDWRTLHPRVTIPADSTGRSGHRDSTTKVPCLTEEATPMAQSIHRRAFLKGASTTAAVLAGAPLLAASRASGADDGLVIAVGQWGIETPFAWRSSQSEKTLWDCVYDPLIMRDPKTFEYRPGLATDWQPSADYKSWTCHLREGVKFHENWGELTGEDVKFTVEQNLRPDAQGGSRSE